MHRLTDDWRLTTGPTLRTTFPPTPLATVLRIPFFAGMLRCWIGLVGWLALTGRADFTVMTWNLKGNGATDWSTNEPQVQAIGRILRHLQPDLVAFQ